MRFMKAQLPESVRRAVVEHDQRMAKPVSFPVVIELKGRIPSKKNSRQTNRTTGRSFPSKAHEKWHKTALTQLPKVNASVGGILSFNIFIRFPDLIDADLTNKTESIMDLLVDAGIISDDNWKVARPLLLDGGLDRKNPGATIRINQRREPCQNCN